MKIVIGLGNHGKEFEKTRHNVGFEIIDSFAKELLINEFKKKNNGVFATGNCSGNKFILLKPQTFVNNSGECVEYFLNYFKVPKENILVVYDDINMTLGKIRFRKNGSSGGHNGIKSIIEKLKGDNFDRLKVGIGYDKNVMLKDWVIGKFSSEENNLLSEKNEEISKTILNWINDKNEDKK